MIIYVIVNYCCYNRYVSVLLCIALIIALSVNVIILLTPHNQTLYFVVVHPCVTCRINWLPPLALSSIHRVSEKKQAKLFLACDSI